MECRWTTLRSVFGFNEPNLVGSIEKFRWWIIACSIVPEKSWTKSDFWSFWSARASFPASAAQLSSSANPPNELKPISEYTDTSTFTIYSNDKRELWRLTNSEHLNFWVGCGPVDVRFLSRVWMTCTWHRTCTWINTWQIPAPIATQLTAQTKMFLYATQNSETFWIILDVIVFGDPSSTCSRYLRMAAFRE